LRAAAGAAGVKEKGSPFSPRWVMDRMAYGAWFQSRMLGDPFGKFTVDAAKHFRRVMDNPEMELAATLEKSINGTSLVLIFRVGKAVLLFPGDAQWGTWNEILEDERTRRLLKDLSFYKVGHHGSHNATPRRFVEELLPPTALAMIPTDMVKQWPLIPKPELLQALQDRGVAFVRGDVADAAEDRRFRRHVVDGATRYIDLELPAE